MRLFQGAAFEAPRHVGNRTYWNVQNAELDGMHSNKAKTISDHEVDPLHMISDKLLTQVITVYGRQLPLYRRGSYNRDKLV